MQQELNDVVMECFENHCNKYNIPFKKGNYIVKSKFCDFQFNGILSISKALGKNIYSFTTDLLKELSSFYPKFNFQIVPNKYIINIDIDNDIISKYTINDNMIFQIQQSNSQKILIDYSSPNIAKELHVGHLRSTILGNALANMYESFGHEVHRVNHIGDWGSQFGMVIAYIKNNDLENKLMNHEITITELMQIYQKAKKQSNVDEEFNEKKKLYVRELQNGNENTTELWKKICQISRDDYENIYETLNINPILEYGESFYNQYIPNMINELKKYDLLIESNNAMIVETTKGVPLIIIKSGGGYTYDTTDLAAIWYRSVILKMDKILYLTDAGQRVHFEAIFEVAKKIGWTENIDCQHIGFGLITNNGNKISSRNENNNVNGNSNGSTKLKDLLNDVIQLSKEMWENKQNNIDDNHVKKQYLESRHKDGYKDIAINSLKYFDFTHQYQTSYEFNKKQMLQFEGNTATYVMYRYAQINNILKQKSPHPNSIFKPYLDVEKNIGLLICDYKNVVVYAYKNNRLDILVKYIFEISQNFSSMWNYKNKLGLIIGSDHEESRLRMCTILKQLYENIFNILGMKLLASI